MQVGKASWLAYGLGFLPRRLPAPIFRLYWAGKAGRPPCIPLKWEGGHSMGPKKNPVETLSKIGTIFQKLEHTGFVRDLS